MLGATQCLLVSIKLKVVVVPFSGGITLTFDGKNLDVVQNPLFKITDSRFNQTVSTVGVLEEMISKVVFHCK